VTQWEKFGDLFHEIPEPEIFLLPCGGSVSSECVINSLGQTYTVEVIPRQAMIDRLMGMTPHDDIAFGFRVDEIAGTREARVKTELGGLGFIWLATVDADSLPEVKQAA
jgi:hypothetical protein